MSSDNAGRAAATAYIDGVAGRAPRQVFSPRRAAIDEVRLYGLSAPDHWHLVTIGLADLGFELTVRLPRPDDSLPTWAVDLLVSLAAYARRSGHPFADGHHIDLRGPIRLGSDTAITAAAVTADPTLGTLGAVEFLQVMGLTADELELCRSWRTAAVIGLLRQRDPASHRGRLGLTELERPSLLDDPALREVAEAGVAAEGSALEELQVASLSWRRRRSALVVTLGAGAATALGPALRRKLNREGARFVVVGDAGELRFEVTSTPEWRLVSDDGGLAVQLPLAGVDEIANLFNGSTGTGRVAALAGVRFVVIA